MSGREDKFVSRGGRKLDAALEAFGLDVRGWVCADFGCNVGGFTDCLLQRRAGRVYAVDTGYGELAWRLRRDDRVVVMERTNALHCPAPEPVDLVVADMAWTPQSRIVPAAARWLKRDANGAPAGRILSLLKPHYELAKMSGPPRRRALQPGQAERICRDVCIGLGSEGLAVTMAMRSVLRGKGGNTEFVLLLAPWV